MERMEQELAKANASLHLVKITHKGNRLYFRGTFPSKKGIGKERYEFASGCVATLEGLKIAKAKALQMESSLMLGTFKWTELGIKDYETVEYCISQYKEWFIRNRGVSAQSAEYWDVHCNQFLKILPKHEKLTCNLLRKALYRYPVHSSGRRECYNAFRNLCIANSLEFDFSDLKSTYSINSVDPRILPSDEEILESWAKIPMPEWRWVYGMMATYGLRNHEVFRLDLSGMQDDPPIAIVTENSKTGAGIVYPYPAAWVDAFNLKDIRLPKLKRFDEITNRVIGGKVWTAFNRYVDFNPYQLRHAFAVRMAKTGVPDTVAAKMMRHDLNTHYRVYQRHFSQRDMEEVWNRLNSTDLAPR